MAYAVPKSGNCKFWLFLLDHVTSQRINKSRVNIRLSRSESDTTLDSVRKGHNIIYFLKAMQRWLLSKSDATLDTPEINTTLDSLWKRHNIGHFLKRDTMLGISWKQWNVGTS